MPTRPPTFTLHKRDPKQAQREHDRRRGNASERGYDGRWRKFRKLFLARNPLCVYCKRKGRLTLATVVDHVIPHRGDQELFWRDGNHQGLCKACHDSTKAREERRDAST